VAATVHVVGAGLAGLATALTLSGAGQRVALYEASGQAGGRCRSYHDRRLDCVIDNGNHLLLSANHAALDYLREIGSRDELIGPPQAQFPFLDLAQGNAWTLRPAGGRLPWWIFRRARRVPDTKPGDYLAAWRLAWASEDATVAAQLRCAGPLWTRFWVPLTLAALNSAPEEASARLLWRVLRETFLAGEAACRPLVARRSLAATFIDPALACLESRGVTPAFGHRLRAMEIDQEQVRCLHFAARSIALDAGDRVVLALPPSGAAALLPNLDVPLASRAIVNAHYRLATAPSWPAGAGADLPMLGLLGGRAQWLFLRGAVVSLTVSAAEDMVGLPNEVLAEELWHDAGRALGHRGSTPPARIVKERQATFAQTPAEVARRPATRGPWRNMVLAGDWTDTGFPATIEGAIRSGRTAAHAVTRI
jgi:squalene-associated FAD-dependent desaturase